MAVGVTYNSSAACLKLKCRAAASKLRNDWFAGDLGIDIEMNIIQLKGQLFSFATSLTLSLCGPPLGTGATNHHHKDEAYDQPDPAPTQPAQTPDS